MVALWSGSYWRNPASARPPEEGKMFAVGETTLRLLVFALLCFCVFMFLVWWSMREKTTKDFTVYKYPARMWLLCANSYRAELWVIDHVLRKGFQPHWPQKVVITDDAISKILETITRDGYTWESGEEV